MDKNNKLTNIEKQFTEALKKQGIQIHELSISHNDCDMIITDNNGNKFKAIYHNGYVEIVKD